MYGTDGDVRGGWMLIDAMTVLCLPP